MHMISKFSFLTLILIIANAPFCAEAQEASPYYNKPVEKEHKGLQSWSPSAPADKTDKKEKADTEIDKKDKNTEQHLSKEDQETLEKLDNELKETEKSHDETLTPEEKLWKKYKALAENNKNKQNDEKSTETKKPEQQKENNEKDSASKSSENNDLAHEETPKEDEKNTDEAKATNGILAILEKYKKSQENKGGMNSRSFGDIE